MRKKLTITYFPPAGATLLMVASLLESRFDVLLDVKVRRNQICTKKFESAEKIERIAKYMKSFKNFDSEGVIIIEDEPVTN